MRAPCALRALGMVNALGSDLETIRARLLAGDDGGFVARDDLVPNRSILVAPARYTPPELPSELARHACHNNQLALAALQAIEEPVRAAVDGLDPVRVGVVVGTSTGGVDSLEHALRHRDAKGSLAPAFDYQQLELGGLAAFIADWLGARGPTYTLSTACSSSARALASARSLLELDLCDVVISGGADTLCSLTTGGFSALQAVAPERTNPMSQNRRGLTLGEGAALFLMTREPNGIQLVGVGESCDAHHMSAPEPEGTGPEAAMRQALEDAGAQPEDVVYVNLHGTGTPLNDAMESRSVARVLGTGVPCSSTKPLVGHTLGAAGATEIGFCWLALQALEADQIPLPPHVFDGERDPELPPIRLVAPGERAALADGGLVLSNAFGFGGNNCSLALARGTA
ncbi:MAG: beta-ketoacyl-ACP synthase [Proteobacteria bacterium]|nr:beta-ketoacyl-ACP synthase [Pseudomonadota bacterium]